MSLNMLPLCTKVGSGTQTCHKWWWPGKKAYSLASHAAQVGGEHGAKFFKLKYYAVITGYSHAVLRNNREMLCTFCPISPNGSFLKKQKNNYSTISQSGDWHWYNQIQNISITAIKNGQPIDTPKNLRWSSRELCWVLKSQSYIKG